ncbi:MAG: hypothetical protein RIM84_26430 [Alphaproteobacteria bacterium]
MATINLADGLSGIGQVIGGAGTGDYLGQSVSGGGDVNGDGIPDLVIGAYLLDGGAANSGGAYVVFGGDTTFDSAVDVVGGLGTTSIRLRGEATSDGAGAGVSVVGDVNNDGIDDILIGAPGNGGKGAGYVVFGSASLATNIDLGSLGSDGFKISGAYTGDSVGAAVAIIGDVDDDGIDDLVLGAPGGDYAGFNYGGAYVVFGDGSLGSDITLPASSVNMYAEGDTYAGRGVRGFGDVNDDGIEDFIIGSDGASTAGRSYVVFGDGTPFSSPFALDNLTATDGFDITGEAAGDAAGAGNVAILGDINGDGVADIGVGAPGSDTGGSDAGAAYLIFGGSGLGADIALGGLGAGGIKIVGENADDEFGDDIRTAGDFNGDGIDDVLIVAGAYGSGRGAVYIIFGQSGLSGPIDLSSLADDEGVKIVGDTGDGLSQAAGVGDVNNDGLDDILIGAPTADDGSADTGQAYVIFGFAQIDGDAGDDSLTGGDAADSLTGNAGNDTLIGNGGNDSLFGGLNDDSIEGGTGDDLLSSGTGNDSLFGGAGTDTAEVSFGGMNEFQVRLLTGSLLNGLLTAPQPGDGVIQEGVFTGAAVRMQFTGGEAGFQLLASDIEQVQFGDGTVDLSAIVDLDLASLGIEELFVGGTGDNVVTGEATDDVMAAGAGNDTVDGVGGNDRAYGQAGDDMVMGGTGNDSLFGNLGEDTVIGGAGDDSLKSQTNDDMLMGEAGNDVAFGGGNDDMIDGGDGSDTLNGNSGFDTILGGAGNDTLRGQGGRDSLNGGDGDDLLLGMQGFDTLVGGAGNDGLIGGPADDTLTGGAGIDSFTFAAGHGSNTITDFEDGIDMISIQGFAFADVTIASASDDTVITVDGDDLTITLTSVAAGLITAADFVFG